MIIKSFYIKEKFVENIDTFSGKRNLIYSKSNSKGKSTYLRLLFYALGYSIPQMKDIKYSDIVTELYFEEKNIEKFIEKLEKLYPSIQYVNRLMTHSWGQKVIRFYDLDGNLIEVGTPV